MKKLLFAFILILGISAQAQSLQKYTRGKKMTTTEINAIDTTRTDVVYYAYNTDLGIDIINRRDNQGWVPLVTAGGITDAQIAAGFLNIHPNTDLNANDELLLSGERPMMGDLDLNYNELNKAFSLELTGPENYNAKFVGYWASSTQFDLQPYKWDNTTNTLISIGNPLSWFSGANEWRYKGVEIGTGSGSPQTPAEIRDALQTLTANDRLDATAIKNLPANGGGDVTKVGTPVDNQLAVWTGNGTVEGTSDLVFNNSGVNRFLNIRGGNGNQSYTSVSVQNEDDGQAHPGGKIELRSYGWGSAGLFLNDVALISQENSYSRFKSQSLGFQVITPNGQVGLTSRNEGLGLGVEIPTERLEVLGNVKATSFKVTGQTDASNLLAGNGTLIPFTSVDDQNALEVPYTNNSQSNVGGALDNLYSTSFKQGINTISQTTRIGESATTSNITLDPATNRISLYADNSNYIDMYSGVLKFAHLSGTGDRMVVAASNGNITTQPIPSSGSGDSADDNLHRTNYGLRKNQVLTAGVDSLNATHFHVYTTGTDKYKRRINVTTGRLDLFPDASDWANISEEQIAIFETSNLTDTIAINSTTAHPVMFDGQLTNNAAYITGLYGKMYVQKKGNNVIVTSSKLTAYTYTEPGGSLPTSSYASANAANTDTNEANATTGFSAHGFWQGVTSQATQVYDGDYAIQLTNDGTSTMGMSRFQTPLAAGTYTVSVWLYAPGGLTPTTFTVREYGVDDGTVTTQTYPAGITAGWVNLTFTKTVGAGQTGMDFRFENANGQTLYIDGIEIN